MQTFKKYITIMEKNKNDFSPKNTSVEKILKIAPWLKDADTTDAIIGIKSNRIVWYNGTWNNGTWKDGIWESGTWKDGTWEDGIWNNGTWNNGTWHDGTWKKGSWKNGTWKSKKNLRPDKRK